VPATVITFEDDAECQELDTFRAATKQGDAASVTPRSSSTTRPADPAGKTRLDRTLVDVAQAAKARRHAAPRKKTASKKIVVVRRRTKALKAAYSFRFPDRIMVLASLAA
jgi:hypothetical protein